jgi:ParB-like chromosome segregation protein Spo0J
MPRKPSEVVDSSFAVATVPIGDVVPYSRNPRKNTAAIAKVAASLREFGWRQPIVVDAEMTVIAGHTRLEAARSLGYGEVPVHIATGLTKSQVKAYRLADNRVGEEAEWDKDLLALEVNDLQLDDFDVAVLGFDDEELGKLLNGDAPADTSEQLRDGVQYQLLVECASEQEQATLCEDLESRGLTCRLLTL